jgi:N-acetylneuraminate synthase
MSGAMAPVVIAGRPIGPGHPPFIIAELSGNHQGELARALALIDAAKAAGADAVKLQTYTADTLTLDHDGAPFRLSEGPWAGRTLHDLYREAATPWAWHAALFAHARRLGLIVFSAPFDPTAVAFLESFDPPAYKIASFELVDLPLIAVAARCRRPMILSTGLASGDEVAEAVATARGAGCDQLLLLHCVSGYPTPPGEANLRRLSELAAGFAVPCGLSDHTLGTAVAVAAVALGACVIEKHLTLARADGGPDAGFSLEPDEFARLSRDCRDAWAALQPLLPGIAGSERMSMAFRRSLFAVADIAAGERFTADNVRSIRPGDGLAPKRLPEVLGRRAACAIRRGTPLAWDLIAP